MKNIYIYGLERPEIKEGLFAATADRAEMDYEGICW